MKFKRLLLLVLICALALCGNAFAEASLSARVEGNALSVAWNAACAGNCTLTLYVDGWPMEVMCVQPSGSLQYSVNDASRRYAARLKTPNGCLTAEANGTQKPIATPVPTAEPTPVPTAVPAPVPTPVPTAVPTTEPTIAPTAVPTPVPTPVPTAVPTPIPTAVPTATPASGNSSGDLASQVVAQVNAEREKAGLGGLRVDSELTRAAQVRAREIVQQFSHTRPDGTAWSTVSGSAYGENIAMGQRSADQVMAAWMSSQGHRENILRASYGSIGVCAYISGGVIYWVQLFGK
ncbi:MAG: hypothetical protein IJ769_00700 [Clostridia bacterium]|nr:hypothetical protein [Clostridia bacterium]